MNTQEPVHSIPSLIETTRDLSAYMGSNYPIIDFNLPGPVP